MKTLLRIALVTMILCGGIASVTARASIGQPTIPMPLPGPQCICK